MGYMGLLTKYIMNHMVDQYRQITAEEIEMKKNAFKDR